MLLLQKPLNGCRWNVAAEMWPQFLKARFVHPPIFVLLRCPILTEKWRIKQKKQSKNIRSSVIVFRRPNRRLTGKNRRRRVWTCSYRQSRPGCQGWTDCHRDLRGRHRCTRRWAERRECRCWRAVLTHGPSRSPTPAWRQWRSRWSRDCAYCEDLRWQHCCWTTSAQQPLLDNYVQTLYYTRGPVHENRSLMQRRRIDWRPAHVRYRFRLRYFVNTILGSRRFIKEALISNK